MNSRLWNIASLGIHSRKDGLKVRLGQHLKHSPRTIGSEAGYLTGSTQQSRRDGVKVAPYEVRGRN